MACLDCRPNCCKPTQNAWATDFKTCPFICEQCCDHQFMPFKPKAGEQIAARSVVYFTGNDVTVDIDGTVVAVAEVTGVAGAAADIAGVSRWDIDNTLDDTGSTSFLVYGVVYSCGIGANGASISDLKKAGIYLKNIVQ